MKDFIKKYQVILMITLSLVLFLVLFILVSKIISNINSKNALKYDEEKTYYTYIQDEKLEFTLKKGVNKYGFTEEIETNEKRIDNNNIIYGENEVIFPKTYAIVFYNQARVFKLNKYANIYKNNDYVMYNKENLSSFFLTDTQNSYFFPKNVILKLNNEEINLSDFSYIKALGDVFYVYDYENDEIKKYDNINVCLVTMENVILNLKEKTFVNKGNIRMLPHDVKSLSIYERKEK